eukprot:2499567-Pyramimonas_sp.AAC.1
MSASKGGAAGLENLEKMGAHGKHSQNLFRGLLHAFGLPSGAPEFTWIELGTKLGPKTPHPVLLPHQFFSAYFNHRRAGFKKYLTGPKGSRAQYWRSIADSAFVRSHPVLEEKLWD